jgi:peptidoglycan/xylan/chitin deacetylase (PgdA/CDA1 family)
MSLDLVSGAAPGWPLVLYFHHVSDAIDHYTASTPASFTAILARLSEEFSFLSPHALGDVRANSVEGQDRPRVLLTFDDGYASQYQHALPALQRAGVMALFFVNPRLHDQDARAGGALREPLMTWDQLREIAALGHRIGSHGQTHAPVPTLAAADWAADLAASREDISREIGQRPSEYAYPYGLVPADERMVLDHYDLGFGTVKAPGRPWDEAPHQIRRVFVPINAKEQARRVQQWKETS